MSTIYREADEIEELARKTLGKASALYYEAIVQADEAFKEAKIKAQKMKEIAPPSEKAFKNSTALSWKVYEGFVAWRAYDEIMNPATRVYDEAIQVFEEAVALGAKMRNALG